VPLDADDLPDCTDVAECLAGLGHLDAAFAYTDIQVFGTQTFGRGPASRTYISIARSQISSYAALIRKRDWEMAGGYDQPMKGYEN